MLEQTVETQTSATEEQTVKAQVAELYIATFGRAPDKAGLDYWTNEVVTGNLTLDGVASSFFDADETKALYANSSNEDFIISVYDNALGKTVDGSDHGVEYWLKELDEGTISKDVFIKSILAGAKAETGDANDALLLQNKVNTGLLYSEEIGVADSPLAKEIMSNITYEDSTAEDAMGTISYYKGWIEKYDNALDSESGISKDELYKHIDDDEYWENLEQTQTLDFDTESTVKFWKQDDKLWEEAIAGKESIEAEEAEINSKFDFLDNEEAWGNASEFQSFHKGEFADIDIDSIFGYGDVEEDALDKVDEYKEDALDKVDEYKEDVLDTIDEYEESDIANEFSDSFTMYTGEMTFNDYSEPEYALETSDSGYSSDVEISGVVTSETDLEVA